MELFVKEYEKVIDYRWEKNIKILERTGNLLQFYKINMITLMIMMTTSSFNLNTSYT